MEILFFGFLFGVILSYAKLNKFNTISGLAILENLAVVKTIFLSIGIGSILLFIQTELGFSSYHIKPFLLLGVVFGGILFGIGMAILGYCPGTLAISIGEGSLDALIGLIGGLIGGLVYTISLPSFKSFLGPDLGEITFLSSSNSDFLSYGIVFVFGILFMYFPFFLDKKDKTKDRKWIFSGIMLAILSVVVFSNLVADRPIGASTSFPYLADLITGLTNNNYYISIQSAGSWEAIFLSGAFLAGLTLAMFKKEFKFILIHDNWKRFKGDSSRKRILWSLVGGFILIFGARLAGGCTSGHILSGGMQLAVSSLVFAVFTFIGLLVTGKLFYKKN